MCFVSLDWALAWPYRYSLQKKVAMKNISLPPVCTNEPKHGFLFCDEHLQLAKKHHLPITRKEKDTAAEQQARTALVPSAGVTSCTAEQTTDCVTGFGQLLCSKNHGEKKKGCWSRGLLVFVHGCGHISSFAPLYRWVLVFLHFSIRSHDVCSTVRRAYLKC